MKYVLVITNSQPALHGREPVQAMEGPFDTYEEALAHQSRNVPSEPGISCEIKELEEPRKPEPKRKTYCVQITMVYSVTMTEQQMYALPNEALLSGAIRYQTDVKASIVDPDTMQVLRSPVWHHAI